MKQKVDLSELQEQHLDAMIGLAFDLEDVEEAMRLSSEPDPALTSQEEKQAEAILQTVLARLDEREKAAQQQRRKSRLKRWIPRVIEVAACLALVLAIAMPVAVANSSALRSRVLQLLFEQDEEQGLMRFVFTDDPEAAFDVPEEWTGNYFPSYFPDGFSYWGMNPYMQSAEYRDDEGNQIFFREFSEDTSGSAGTDNSEVTYIDLHGTTAQMIDGDSLGIHTVTITWANDTNWFVVNTNDVDTDEAIAVARSVREIVK